MAQHYSSGPVRLRMGGASALSGSLARRTPPDAEAILASVLSALDAGELETASGRAAAALAAGFEHPVLLCVRAMGLQASGAVEAALPHLHRAVALQPQDASIRNALARCLAELGRYAEALVVVEAALPLQPGNAETHANKGLALERLGELAAAERSYRRALELHPGQVLARVGMANLCLHFGAAGEARAHAEAAVGAAPDYAPAGLALANAALAQGQAADAEARIRRLMAQPGADPWLASHLGDALDVQDRTEEAFQAWTRSGEALRRLHAGAFAADDVLAWAEGAAEALERLPAARWPGSAAGRPPPAPVRQHVLLTGFARSGTSLLGLALEGLEQVEVLQEREPMTDALRRFGGRDGLARLLSASEAELDLYRDAYWRRVRSAGARLDRAVFVDKQPMNALHLPLVTRLFPAARILFMRRDPRDVALGCFRRRFLMNRYTYQLLTAEGSARLYGAAMRIAERTRELASPDMLAVRQEMLVADFRGAMGEVCRVLGLPWSEAIGGFAGRIRSSSVATPSAPQLARGLNADGVGRWRRYAPQLRPLSPILEPWVRRFGYPPTPAESPDLSFGVRSAGRG